MGIYLLVQPPIALLYTENPALMDRQHPILESQFESPLEGSFANAIPGQVRKSIHPARVRSTLQPGNVLILLAGRFRGKRVILLKHLPQGVLLVTGPFKINGVPLRRVNARYVIATSSKVDLKGIDEKVVEKVGEEGYFTRDKAENKKGEEQFFAQGEKPEVSEDCAGQFDSRENVLWLT